MSKFKAGDKVVIKPLEWWEPYADKYESWNMGGKTYYIKDRGGWYLQDFIKSIAGSQQTISSVEQDCAIFYFEFDGKKQQADFWPEMFDMVKESPKVEINVTAKIHPNGGEFLKKCINDIDNLIPPFTPKQKEKIKRMISSSLDPIIAENIAHKTMCEQLKKDLDNLEKQLKKDKKLVQLDTYHGDGYSANLALDSVFHSKFGDYGFNHFRSSESADQARKHLQITCALLNFRAENDRDYFNLNQDSVDISYYFIYKESAGGYIIDNHYMPSHIANIYFSSKELAQSAFDMLKRKGLL